MVARVSWPALGLVMFVSQETTGLVLTTAGAGHRQKSCVLLSYFHFSASHPHSPTEPIHLSVIRFGPHYPDSVFCPFSVVWRFSFIYPLSQPALELNWIGSTVQGKDHLSGLGFVLRVSLGEALPPRRINGPIFFLWVSPAAFPDHFQRWLAL